MPRPVGCGLLRGHGGEVAYGFGRGLSVAEAAELARGGAVVASVVEEGVCAELGVRAFGDEFGAGGEDVEAVAVHGPAGGGTGFASVFRGALPVHGLAAGEQVPPPVGLEDVRPRGFLFEVVPRGESTFGTVAATAGEEERGGLIQGV